MTKLERGLEGIAELVPTGAASERWRRRQGHAPSAEAAWLQGVQRRARAEDRPAEQVHLAWEIARLAPPTHRRGVHLLALVTLGDLGQGSTRTRIDPRLRARLAGLAEPGSTAVDEALEVLADPGLAAPAVGRGRRPPAPLVLIDDAIQLERMAWLEDRLGERLRARADAIPATELPLDRGRSHQHLTEEQTRAVSAAVTGRLAVVTGGPGTGKTSIVVALIEALIGAGLEPSEIALVAPTGKATHRLGEAIARDLGSIRDRLRTETLHRLLGARPGHARFVHHRDHPLPVRVVVCDEASMLDLELATRLLDALEPDARLVLLGDADQLPSVDAGAVLRQLVDALPDRAVVRLTHSFRMDAADPAGRRVLELGRALHAGEADRVRAALGAGDAVRLRAVRGDAERSAFLAEHLRASPLGDEEHRRRARRLRRYVEGRFVDRDLEEVTGLLEASARIQLLTVTRRLPFAHGSDAISTSMHVLYAQQEGLPEQARFLPGEPVMMLRNDYERRLFNGDIGMVLQVAVDREAARPMAVFDGADGPEAFDLGPLGHDLVLAHAITVHKAQGSEYDRVALLLPEVDVPLLTREVLYTAVTRARRGVIIAGDPDLLQAGLSRRVSRESGLADRLRGRAEVEPPSREEP